jgi:hypothetical protein
MCPVCLTTVALVAGGGASVAGVTAVIWRFRSPDPVPAATISHPEGVETHDSTNSEVTTA